MDDWKSISRYQLIDHGADHLLILYNNNFENVLRKVYADHHWHFDHSKMINQKEYFKLIENQRKFMDELFFKLKLKSFDDWLNIKKIKFISNGGEFLFSKYKNIKNILRSIYPNYYFDFDQLNYQKITYFKSIENQRKFMEKLYLKLELKSIDDWLNISMGKISKNGGGKLIFYYEKKMEKLLTTIYPNFPFNFDQLYEKKRKLAKLIDCQIKFFDELFFKYKLKSFDDWMNISKKQLKIEGGRTILYKKKNDRRSLLRSIYPNYPWESFHRDQLRNKIIYWIKEFQITKKQDWYRFPIDFGSKFEVFRTLKIFYPKEEWNKKKFINRTKKASQRILFSYTSKIYSSLLIIENYLHPRLINKNELELDLFIPSLEMGVEHHYDDLPGAFGLNELFLERDLLKERLANKMKLKKNFLMNKPKIVHLTQIKEKYLFHCQS